MNGLPDQDLNIIFNALGAKKCLVFLGAGACTSYPGTDGAQNPGLPTGSELAKALATECKYANGALDLPKVAEYFVYSHGGNREPLESALRRHLSVRCQPRPIHTVLSQLNHVKIVVTSNYDMLLENALASQDRNLIKHVHNPRNPKTGDFEGPIPIGETEIVMHKMHGTIEDPQSLVITQSDYIQYLLNLTDIDKGMPEYFRKVMIPRYNLLFLGYSLEDWNFRVIWEGVLSTQTSRSRHITAYALMKNPSHHIRTYWSNRNIQIFEEDLTEFARKVALHFNLDIPQLGLTRTP
jgi:hypothetical protein